MKELEYKIKELEARIKNLKSFVSRDLVDIINSRLIEVEKEIERVKREIADMRIKLEEVTEYEKLKEKLEKKIDRRILDELDI